ncbi:MAG: DUF4922 domain-containing protein [Xanthomonadales bacterium]|nr:DUF4922 domain-containing protein [Xanthomonadales bacterium]
MDQFNTHLYEQVWTDLNFRLDRIGVDQGLGAALLALRDHQLETGFITDDLSEVERIRLPNRRGNRSYYAQYNPARARRFSGSGVTEPPPGAAKVNDGCFLCPENIQWQQFGREVGYDLQFDDREYVAWMNPYPLAPSHTVIAARNHIPQYWGATPHHLAHMVHDLLDLAHFLPGWIGFYNGEGAGASIPHHLHYQFFPRPPDYGRFPLERAVWSFGGDSLLDPVLVGRYPLDFAYWKGTHEDVVRRALPWIAAWARKARIDPDATANVIVINQDDGEGLQLFFVPRDRRRARSKRMTGIVGGLEVLGEIVCSSEDERRRLASKELNYKTVKDILSDVSVGL